MLLAIFTKISISFVFHWVSKFAPEIPLPSRSKLFSLTGKVLPNFSTLQLQSIKNWFICPNCLTEIVLLVLLTLWKRPNTYYKHYLKNLPLPLLLTAARFASGSASIKAFWWSGCSSIISRIVSFAFHVITKFIFIIGSI